MCARDVSNLRFLLIYFNLIFFFEIIFSLYEYKLNLYFLNFLLFWKIQKIINYLKLFQ